jgi:hypothetical protein
LRRQDTERESRVDELAGQLARRARAAVDDLAGKTELLGIGHTFVDRSERAAVIEIGRVHGVAGRSQFARERGETFCLAQRVMEQQYLCHRLAPFSAYDATPAVLAAALAAVCSFLRISK